MEAVMGAVWLDGGIGAAKSVFGRLELPIGEKLNEWSDNPKGHLQVISQSMKPSRKPVYTVESVKGPPHAPVVTVNVEVGGLGRATATAGSLRQAEAAAACALLEELEKRGVCVS
jgi:ribonuclease-3